MLSNTDDRRTPLLVSALRLSYFTIGWNGVAGASALVASIVASSPALAAFALNALLDSSASVVLVWSLSDRAARPGCRRTSGTTAHGWIAAPMVVVGLDVGVEAIRAVVGGSPLRNRPLAWC